MTPAISAWAYLLGAPRAESATTRSPRGPWSSSKRCPLFGLAIRIVTLWNIDSRAPELVTNRPAVKDVVFIPTYNQPIEVIAPTIATSVALEPRYDTWVLDDGDRAWVRAPTEQYGARFIRREEHT